MIHTNRIQFKNILSNPFTVFFFFTALSNQGIIIQASFYFFQTNSSVLIEHFSIMFLGLVLSYLFGFFIGFDIKNIITKNFLFIGSIINSLLLFILIFIFPDDTLATIVDYFLIGLFGGYITLQTLVSCLQQTNNKNRMRITALIFFLWFSGQAIFGIFFIYSIQVGLILAFLSSIIGLGGLYFFLEKIDESDETKFSRISVMEVISPNIISLIMLFSIYGLILFSFIQIYSQHVFPSISNYSGSINASILIGIAITTFTSLIIYFLNKKASLRTIYSLVYVVISISLLLLLFDIKNISFVFYFSILIWSYLGSFVFISITQMYPRTQILQLISFWWLSLTLSFGGGLLIPLIITNTDHLLYFNLTLILFSIFLFSYLSAFSNPLRVYYLILFTPAGIPIYSRGYLNLDQSLITGLLSGIMQMFKEVFAVERESSLRSIDHGDKKLLLSKTELLFGVLVVNHVEPQAEEKLEEITEMFTLTFHNNLLNDPSRVSAFRDLPPLLLAKIDFFQKE